ncbi:MAG: sulfurtransferase [Actinomycetota bacterium]|nr:sulfurtransferase [Actinomycetota bacterium]
MRYQFVDCRWELGNPERGRELYLEGHVPGATFLDVEHELSGPPGQAPHHGGRHPLPDEGHFARAAGNAGIGPGVFAVAYDQGRTGGAARLWWLLRHFGHDDVAVLVGGIDAWLGPLQTGEETGVETARFVPRPRHDDTISAEELGRRLGDERLVLVDARAPERYRGEVEPLDPIAGHIPGAVNVPFTAGDLPRAVVEAPEIVVYCGSGITACVDLLDLVRAGRPDARLYPGSWSDWSSRGLPAERA